jgi:hypothetical protein
MHIYEREVSGLTFQAGRNRQLFPIGFPPCGYLQRMMFKFRTSPAQAFKVRVYDRDWAIRAPVTAYAPTLDGNGAVQATAHCFTVTSTTNFPTTGDWYGNVIWSVGGLAAMPQIPGNVQPTSVRGLYPGQRFSSTCCEFTSNSATDVTLTTLGTAGTALPVNATMFSGGTMYLEYTGTDTALSLTSGAPVGSVILDENTAVGNGRTNLNTVINDTTVVVYSDGHGVPYQNREGSFSVPIRKLYLEVDFGANSPSADCIFDCELACQIGNENN